MNSDSLNKIYTSHSGKESDKWSLYLTEYDRIFNEIRMNPVSLLEIGVQNGGSLEIWAKYFENYSLLIGCDINPDCSRLIYDDRRIGVVIGDANAPQVKKEIVSRSSLFDVIIDDGSHVSGDIIKTFLSYFRHLAADGIFIAEDLHCSYWSRFDGGLYDPYSSISFFKRLADVINYEHWGVDGSRSDIFESFFARYGERIDEAELAQIHSVEFINSMCVVRKAAPLSNSLGTRVIAGDQAIVVSGNSAFHGSTYQLDPLFDQSVNSRSALHSPPEIVEEELKLNNAKLLRDLEQLSLAFEDQTQRLDSLKGQIHEILGSRSWRITYPMRSGASLIYRLLYRLRRSVRS